VCAAFRCSHPSTAVIWGPGRSPVCPPHSPSPFLFSLLPFPLPLFPLFELILHGMPRHAPVALTCAVLVHVRSIYMDE
jgi:hypothetical protein